MKRIKFLQGLAILAAVVTIVTSVFGNYSFVNAAETTTQDEKVLVQCSDDWTIFQYKDDAGEPTFDLYYQGKSPEKLKNEGLKIQYGIVLKKDHRQKFYLWYDLNEIIDTEEIFDNELDFYLIQFRVVTNDDEQISTSSHFYLYNTSALYILEANYSTVTYESYLITYNLICNPNTFKISLKVSEPLKKVGDLSILMQTDYSEYLSNYSASNLSFENHTEKYNFQGKVYDFEYSTITFDVVLSPAYYKVLETDIFYFWYTLEFNGLEGLYSSKQPESLRLNVCVPTVDPNNIPAAVQSINISTPSSKIKVGESISLTANILPSDATNKALIWSSSNEDCATVNSNGVVTAKKAGTVTITATSTNGSNVKGSIEIIVQAPEDNERETSNLNEKETTKNQQIIHKPNPTKITMIRRARKSLKVTWKKIKNINGYQLEYSTSRKFKKSKKITVKKAKVTSKTIKNLKTKKRYYVRIRTYKIIKGQKNYSAWSKPKSQKTK